MTPCGKKKNNNLWAPTLSLIKPSYSLTCSFFSSPPGRLRDEKRIKHYGCPALPCPVKCVGKCPHQFTTGQRADLRKKQRSRRAGRRASLHPPLNNNNKRKLWRAETQAETTDTYRLATSERARERETERKRQRQRSTSNWDWGSGYGGSLFFAPVQITQFPALSFHCNCHLSISLYPHTRGGGGGKRGANKA